MNPPRRDVDPTLVTGAGNRVALVVQGELDQSAELDGAMLSTGDLSRLVAHVEVTVEAHPRSGTSQCHDTWLLIVDPLRIHHADLGLDAAFIGLAGRVRERVCALLREGGEERTRLLPLLIRLDLADRDGSLAKLLERWTLVVDGRPELPV